MPHKIHLKDPFQGGSSWHIPPKAMTVSPDGLTKYDRPCRHGPTCVFLKMGECFYRHEPSAPSVRLQLMMEGLSAPTTLPAFGAVDTTFQWYGIRDVDTLASFNVFKDGRLAIPGLPPALRRPDRDMAYAKPDSFMPACHIWPETPKFNPLLRALRILQPNFNPSSLPLITTAGCLRRITTFLTRGPRTERLDLELRAGTLFVGRWESDELLDRHMGYGKQFEGGVQRYGPGLAGSASSHIVAGYDIGGLQMGVQVEVDAFECECHSHARLLARHGEDSVAKKRLSGGRFDILSGVEDEEEDGAAESMTRVGAQLPLACAVEIKTRRRTNEADYPYLPQLYFQQTPRVFFAVRDGRFFRRGSMEMRDETDELAKWEGANQRLLGRLVALLKMIMAEARKRGDGCKMALVLEGGPEGRAVLYGRQGEELVSDL